jgi:hypothetical protein
MTTTQTQRITLFLTPSLVKFARAQAVVEETTLTVLVEKALIEYLPGETVIKKPDIARITTKKVNK